MLATITPVILFIAWLLLLLVSVSVPITKTIYLYKVVDNTGSLCVDPGPGAENVFTFGLWGYCSSCVHGYGTSTFQSGFSRWYLITYL